MLLLENAQKFFTPIKLFSFIIIMMATIDGFEIRFTSINEYNFLVNFLIRILLFNAAFFGIFGNGNTTRLRTTIVSLPFIYFGIYYLLLFFQGGIVLYFLNTTIFIILGVWILLFGDYYE